MSFLNNFYQNISPVAFEIFSLKVHWYGICYVFALIFALYLGKHFAKEKKIDSKTMDSFFIWVEIGIILGARIGYILIYDTNTSWYLLHPWQIFNPFAGGEFVGIRGMSYHGAIIGFLIACFLFWFKTKKPILRILDICALSIPLGYVFGRIGNFLNHELFGRPTNSDFGVLVNGVMRHPSQLYEAFCEGILVFLAIYFIYKIKNPKDGVLICLYGIFYSMARFFCEFFREPDIQLGFIAYGLSMGQILSLLMFGISIVLLFWVIKEHKVKKN